MLAVVARLTETRRGGLTAAPSTFVAPAQANAGCVTYFIMGGPERAIRPAFSHGSEGGSTPTNEVPQDRDDREKQKQVNQSSSHMEHAEPEDPGQDENDRQGNEHDVFLQVNAFKCPNADSPSTCTTTPKDPIAAVISILAGRALSLSGDPGRPGTAGSRIYVLHRPRATGGNSGS